MKGIAAVFCPIDAVVLTGRKPRPVTARSVEFDVWAIAPLASTSQMALVLTPPAVNQRPPPMVFGDLASATVSEEKSTSARL